LEKTLVCQERVFALKARSQKSRGNFAECMAVGFGIYSVLNDGKREKIMGQSGEPIFDEKSCDLKIRDGPDPDGLSQRADVILGLQQLHSSWVFDV
jgi:hypothetical protein